MKTKIFCDIADFKTIKYFNNKSIVAGFTTNTSLMRLAGAKNYKDYSLKILKICKKKRIGPLRPEPNREIYYKKDMGILARSGFSYDISKKILSMTQKCWINS